MGIKFALPVSKYLKLAALIVNIILLIFAVKYFLWFNFDSADGVLNKYLESIKTGEGQLVIRLLDKYDWVEFKNGNISDYESILISIDKMRARRYVGENKIVAKILLKDKISYHIAANLGDKIKNGKIILLKRVDGWRVLHDNVYLGI